MSFLQSGAAKKISHFNELANLKAVLVHRSFMKCQFLLRNGSFLDSPVLWIEFILKGNPV